MLRNVGSTILVSGIDPNKSTRYSSSKWIHDITISVEAKGFGFSEFSPRGCDNVLIGGVSERPKERASKARVGETQPWVQIPPPPPVTTMQSDVSPRRMRDLNPR
jgi:hypothetical protein